jgi:hypothetical protein
MFPTDGKATNGLKEKSVSRFLDPLGNYFNLIACAIY